VRVRRPRGKKLPREVLEGKRKHLITLLQAVAIAGTVVGVLAPRLKRSPWGSAKSTEAATIKQQQRLADLARTGAEAVRDLGLDPLGLPITFGVELTAVPAPSPPLTFEELVALRLATALGRQCDPYARHTLYQLGAPRALCERGEGPAEKYFWRAWSRVDDEMWEVFSGQEHYSTFCGGNTDSLRAAILGTPYAEHPLIAALLNAAPPPPVRF